MDWKSLGDAAMGAVAGTLGTSALSAWRMGGRIKSVKQDVEAIKVDMLLQRGEREKCKASVHDHHEDDDKHVTKSLMAIVTDIRDRVARIEDHMFNGKH